VISLLFEALMLRMPPKDCDHFGEALEAVDPSHFRDSWKLAEGFVAAEGASIMPNLIKTRPNLRESQRSLLLLCLLLSGLPDALINVIVSSDMELSIQATILLGEFLFLTNRVVPRELNATSHCLPNLLESVASGDQTKYDKVNIIVIINES
jgi:rapamycin-insensitive companion of mTOR